MKEMTTPVPPSGMNVNHKHCGACWERDEDSDSR